MDLNTTFIWQQTSIICVLSRREVGVKIGIVSLFYPYLCQYDVWYIELKEGKCVNPLNPKIKTKILICRLYSFTTEAAGRSW